jgi:hypothetical protein
MQQKLQTKFLYNGLPEILGEGMYTYLHPPLGADEVHRLGVAACHCYVLWRWLFDTLSVTLMRLSPDPQLHLVGIRWFLYLVVTRPSHIWWPADKYSIWWSLEAPDSFPIWWWPDVTLDLVHSLYCCYLKSAVVEISLQSHRYAFQPLSSKILVP